MTLSVTCAVMWDCDEATRSLRPLLVLLPLLFGLTACEPSRSPTARPDIVEQLRNDLAASRHPSDGQGSVRLLEAPEGGAVAGGRGRYRFEFEVGEPGIATGGWIFLQVHPFWGWSTPQTTEVEAPGYTVVTPPAGVSGLESRTLDQQLLGIEVTGEPLAAGVKLEIDYGAGPAESRVDHYAEAASPFWFSVDGDGDGIRGLLDHHVSVVIRPTQPQRLVVRLPSRVAPGTEIRLSIAAVDAVGNFVDGFNAEVEVEGLMGEYAGASRLEMSQGHAETIWRVEQGGVVRVMVRSGELLGVSNPMLVEAGAEPVLWGDLHGHSVLSDGTGSPEDYYRYARYVAALDVAALTDHDHWGIEALATHDGLWQRIRTAALDAHEPGRFVTLLGFEWTSWLHGHRHVLYFDDQGEVLSSVDPRYETPDDLWRALRDRPALTFAHHSAGGPVATNWDYEPDPVLEPVTEIVSVHGSSEAPDSPFPIYSAVPGNFVRDALDRGYRLGFLGSGDGHDGHPGLSGGPSPSGGLAAILASEPTREAVLEALRERRVYATNGPRIVLETLLDGRRMGSFIEPTQQAALQVRVVAEKPLDRIDVIRSGSLVASSVWSERTPRGEREFPLLDLSAGEYLYVRVLQTDGGTAWSSPYFVARD